MRRMSMKNNGPRAHPLVGQDLDFQFPASAFGIVPPVGLSRAFAVPTYEALFDRKVFRGNLPLALKGINRKNGSQKPFSLPLLARSIAARIVVPVRMSSCYRRSSEIAAGGGPTTPVSPVTEVVAISWTAPRRLRIPSFAPVEDFFIRSYGSPLGSGTPESHSPPRNGQEHAPTVCGTIQTRPHRRTQYPAVKFTRGELFGLKSEGART